jgi:PEP-CTERM motif
MKRSLLVAACSVLCAGFLQVASANVATFDDIGGSGDPGCNGVVPDGYAGITWGGNWYCYTEPQPPYTPESLPGRVYTFLPVASFSFSAPTTFQGAYFAGDASATVQFALFDGATPVGTSSVLAPGATPTFLASGYAGPVTAVEVLSGDPDYYVMDNVTFGSPVPEPGLYGLLALGLSGLVTVVSRRKKV